jgi:hypothetical protein
LSGILDENPLDHDATVAMMNATPLAFRKFFAQFAQARQATTVAPRWILRGHPHPARAPCALLLRTLAGH